MRKPDFFTGSSRSLPSSRPSLSASDAAIAVRDDVAFFQAIKAALAKPAGDRQSPETLDAAVRQLVSKAITASDGVIDIFTAAGLKKPDISILSDQALAEVRGLKHKNVASELLAKLLKDELKTRSARNLVQGRAFSEMLKKTLSAYHNRAIATHEVIEELVKLANRLLNHRGDFRVADAVPERLSGVASRRSGHAGMIRIDGLRGLDEDSF